MNGSPWAFHLHAVTWCVLGVLGVCYFRVTGGRQPAGAANGAGAGATLRATRRQRWQFVVAVGSLAVSLTWPVADLAADWSLTALVVQRLLLILLCAPLLILAVPTPLLGRITRPAAVDRLVDFLTRPAAAIVTFMVIVVGTLTVPAVHLQSTSAPARAAFDILLIAAGFVLWMPVFDRVPGARRASAVGRGVYLIVQSILPNFPSFIFVFARHPLYDAFVHSHLAIGLAPVNDQQLAGIVAKVGTLPVLWSASWRALSRAARAEETGNDGEPLNWADVERTLLRLERAERSGRAGRAGSADRTQYPGPSPEPQ